MSLITAYRKRKERVPERGDKQPWENLNMNRSLPKLRKCMQNQFLCTPVPGKDGNVEATEVTEDRRRHSEPLLICRVSPQSGPEASSNSLQIEGLVPRSWCYWEVKGRARVGEEAHRYVVIQVLLFPSYHKVSMTTMPWLPQYSVSKGWGQTSTGWNLWNYEPTCTFSPQSQLILLQQQLIYLVNLLSLPHVGPIPASISPTAKHSC